ncbi:hypothetical protein HYH03_014098 [Edaphochlamys debaryana]|uniref:Uncharacterized protein n=1 Tax=Edaphochlamys debaryana TaxID=47281 RepID=A0A836BS94_9CHLO|nr:hypothetical protein HYH03_014098 [Edaphochlamys debaryana]|eukprot:KAG2487256.1 hypothetical protein HYH03_014098 [Edaphochlamys debaryana]
MKSPAFFYALNFSDGLALALRTDDDKPELKLVPCPDGGPLDTQWPKEQFQTLLLAYELCVGLEQIFVRYFKEDALHCLKLVFEPLCVIISSGRPVRLAVDTNTLRTSFVVQEQYVVFELFVSYVDTFLHGTEGVRAQRENAEAVAGVEALAGPHGWRTGSDVRTCFEQWAARHADAGPEAQGFTGELPARDPSFIAHRSTGDARFPYRIFDGRPKLAAKRLHELSCIPTSCGRQRGCRLGFLLTSDLLQAVEAVVVQLGAPASVKPLIGDLLLELDGKGPRVEGVPDAVRAAVAAAMASCARGWREAGERMDAWREAVQQSAVLAGLRGADESPVLLTPLEALRCMQASQNAAPPAAEQAPAAGPTHPQADPHRAAEDAATSRPQLPAVPGAELHGAGPQAPAAQAPAAQAPAAQAPEAQAPEAQAPEDQVPEAPAEAPAEAAPGAGAANEQPQRTPVTMLSLPAPSPQVAHLLKRLQAVVTGLVQLGSGYLLEQVLRECVDMGEAKLAVAAASNASRKPSFKASVENASSSESTETQTARQAAKGTPPKEQPRSKKGGSRGVARLQVQAGHPAAAEAGPKAAAAQMQAAIAAGAEARQPTAGAPGDVMDVDRVGPAVQAAAAAGRTGIHMGTPSASASPSAQSAAQAVVPAVERAAAFSAGVGSAAAPQRAAVGAEEAPQQVEAQAQAAARPEALPASPLLGNEIFPVAAAPPPQLPWESVAMDADSGELAAQEAAAAANVPSLEGPDLHLLALAVAAGPGAEPAAASASSAPRQLGPGGMVAAAVPGGAAYGQGTAGTWTGAVKATLQNQAPQLADQLQQATGGALAPAAQAHEEAFTLGSSEPRAGNNADTASRRLSPQPKLPQNQQGDLPLGLATPVMFSSVAGSTAPQPARAPAARLTGALEAPGTAPGTAADSDAGLTAAWAASAPAPPAVQEIRPMGASALPGAQTAAMLDAFVKGTRAAPAPAPQPSPEPPTLTTDALETDAAAQACSRALTAAQATRPGGGVGPAEAWAAVGPPQLGPGGLGATDAPSMLDAAAKAHGVAVTPACPQAKGGHAPSRTMTVGEAAAAVQAAGGSAPAPDACGGNTTAQPVGCLEQAAARKSAEAAARVVSVEEAQGLHCVACSERWPADGARSRVALEEHAARALAHIECQLLPTLVAQAQLKEAVRQQELEQQPPPRRRTFPQETPVKAHICDRLSFKFTKKHEGSAPCPFCGSHLKQAQFNAHVAAAYRNVLRAAGAPKPRCREYRAKLEDTWQRRPLAADLRAAAQEALRREDVGAVEASLLIDAVQLADLLEKTEPAAVIATAHEAVAAAQLSVWAPEAVPCAAAGGDAGPAEAWTARSHPAPGSAGSAGPAEAWASSAPPQLGPGGMGDVAVPGAAAYGQGMAGTWAGLAAVLAASGLPPSHQSPGSPWPMAQSQLGWGAEEAAGALAADDDAGWGVQSFLLEAPRTDLYAVKPSATPALSMAPGLPLPPGTTPASLPPLAPLPGAMAASGCTSAAVGGAYGQRMGADAARASSSRISGAVGSVRLPSMPAAASGAMTVGPHQLPASSRRPLEGTEGSDGLGAGEPPLKRQRVDSTAWAVGAPRLLHEGSCQVQSDGQVIRPGRYRLTQLLGTDCASMAPPQAGEGAPVYITQPPGPRGPTRLLRLYPMHGQPCLGSSAGAGSAECSTASAAGPSNTSLLPAGTSSVVSSGVRFWVWSVSSSLQPDQCQGAYEFNSDDAPAAPQPGAYSAKVKLNGGDDAPWPRPEPARLEQLPGLTEDAPPPQPGLLSHRVYSANSDFNSTGVLDAASFEVVPGMTLGVYRASLGLSVLDSDAPGPMEAEPLSTTAPLDAGGHSTAGHNGPVPSGPHSGAPPSSALGPQPPARGPVDLNPSTIAQEDTAPPAWFPAAAEQSSEPAATDFLQRAQAPAAPLPSSETVTVQLSALEPRPVMPLRDGLYRLHPVLDPWSLPSPKRLANLALRVRLKRPDSVEGLYHARQYHALPGAVAWELLAAFYETEGSYVGAYVGVYALQPTHSSATSPPPSPLIPAGGAVDGGSAGDNAVQSERAPAAPPASVFVGPTLASDGQKPTNRASAHESFPPLTTAHEDGYAVSLTLLPGHTQAVVRPNATSERERWPHSAFQSVLIVSHYCAALHELVASLPFDPSCHQLEPFLRTVTGAAEAFIRLGVPPAPATTAPAAVSAGYRFFAAFTCCYWRGVERKVPFPSNPADLKRLQEGPAPNAVACWLRRLVGPVGQALGGWQKEGEVYTGVRSWLEALRSRLDLSAGATAATWAAPEPSARTVIARPSQSQQGAFYPIYPLFVTSGYERNRYKLSEASGNNNSIPPGACGVPAHYSSARNAAIGLLLLSDLISVFKQAVSDKLKDEKARAAQAFQAGLLQPGQPDPLQGPELTFLRPDLAACVLGWEAALQLAADRADAAMVCAAAAGLAVPLQEPLPPELWRELAALGLVPQSEPQLTAEVSGGPSGEAQADLSGQPTGRPSNGGAASEASTPLPCPFCLKLLWHEERKEHIARAQLHVECGITPQGAGQPLCGQLPFPGEKGDKKPCPFCRVHLGSSTWAVHRRAAYLNARLPPALRPTPACYPPMCRFAPDGCAWQARGRDEANAAGPPKQPLPPSKILALHQQLGLPSGRVHPTLPKEFRALLEETLEPASRKMKSLEADAASAKSAEHEVKRYMGDMLASADMLVEEIREEAAQAVEGQGAAPPRAAR